MSVEQGASAAETILAARGRYVARGVATPTLVVDRAEGARVWDADGREYLDFAGGIACQNLGHGPSAVVAAIHEQVDRYLHQCFMVGTYEPYVEVCRRLDELWPGDAATKSILVNSGAEAIENAVKIARAATGRPGVVVFDRAFHGRTNLTMAMTSKLVYKQGFGPLATDVYRAPAPYPFRGVTTEDALAASSCSSSRTSTRARSRASCSSRCRAKAASSRCRRSSSQALRGICDEHGIVYVDDEVQAGCGRTGTMWAIEQLRRRAGPDRLGQDARRRPAARGGDRSRGADGRRARRRARRHVRREPRRLRGRARRARRALGTRLPRSARSRSAASCARDSTRSPHGIRSSARCAASARCSRSSCASRRRRREGDDRGARERAAPPLVRPLRERDPAAAAAVGDGRGARTRARDPGGGTWRRRRRTRLKRSRPRALPRCA